MVASPASGVEQNPSSDDPADGAAAVQLLLHLHGLTPSDAECGYLAAQYASVRAGVQRLYDVPGTRYAAVPLVFDPRHGER